MSQVKLIQSEVDENKYNELSLLMKAIEKGDESEAMALVVAGASIHKKDKGGWTALNWACMKPGFEKLVQVLIERGSKLDERDSLGRTPLMLAEEWGNKTTSVLLLLAGASHEGSKAHILSKEEREELLHQACRENNMILAKALIENGCSVRILTSEEQEILLLWAWNERNMYIVCNLIMKGCNVSVLPEMEQNKLLQHAWHSNMHVGDNKFTVIQPLIWNGCNVSSLSQGQQHELLYHACVACDIVVVEALTAMGCNVNCVYKTQAAMLTPLMVATQMGHAEIVKKLILAGANLEVQNEFGNTALHIAASHNHTQCGILLAEGGASMMTKNSSSQIPLDLAEAEFKEAIKQAVSFTTRKALCVIGNAESGKSTLIAALQAESNSFLGKTFNRIRKVSDRRQRTTGIETIPHCSQRYGEVLFFDFAGQHEYHGPHQMFLESLLSKPGVSMTILLVVKVIEEEEAILHQLHRWLSPVAQMCNAPQVIVIGSFMDKVKPKEEATAKLTRCIEATERDLEESPPKFVGTCFLNCRQPQSEGMDHLCCLLQEIPIPEFRATHTQYSLAWVLSQIRLCCMPQAMQLQDFTKWIQDKRDNLPMIMPSPEEVCQDLTASGHALYLPNKQDPQKSWLVLDLPSILHDVYGTLFSQSKKMVNMFGLLHCQCLAEVFPRLDQEMVQQLLISLEFCIPVDPSVLQVEVSKLTRSEEVSGWLFFPALISAKPPQPIWERVLQQGVHYLCWRLKTSKKHSLSARILQAILLRLAAKFVVIHCLSESVEQHCCSIWLNGIAWQSKKGVDVTVHITNNEVIQVVGASQTSADKSCQYLTDVISDILSTVRRLSPKLVADSYIVHPPLAALHEEVSTLTLSPQVLFPVADIQDSIQECEEYCLSLKGSNKPSNSAAISDLFGGCSPTLEDIEGINWTLPEPSQPLSSAEPSQPQSSAEPSQTKSSAEPSQPQSSVEPSQPQSSVEPRQPQSSVEPSQPQSSAEPSQPELSGEPSQPQSSVEPSQPQSSAEPSQPQSLAEPSQPELSGEPSQPQSSVEPSQPQLSAEPSQPELSVEPSQPQSLVESSQPELSGEPSQPQSSSEPSQAQSTVEPSQPQSSVELSQYQSQLDMSLNDMLQSSADPNQPQSSVELSQPHTPSEPSSSRPQSSVEPNQPQLSSQCQSSVELNQPQLSAEPSQLQSSAEPSQPQSSAELKQSLNRMHMHQSLAELRELLSGEPSQRMSSAEPRQRQLSSELSKPQPSAKESKHRLLVNGSEPRLSSKPVHPQSSAKPGKPQLPPKTSKPQLPDILANHQLSSEPTRSQSFSKLIQPKTKFVNLPCQHQLSAKGSKPQSSANASTPQSTIKPSRSQSLSELNQSQASAEHSQPQTAAELSQSHFSAKPIHLQSSDEPSHPHSATKASKPQSSTKPSKPQLPAKPHKPQLSTEPSQQSKPHVSQFLSGLSQPQSSVQPSMSLLSSEPYQHQPSTKQGSRVLLDVSFIPDMRDVDELVVTAVAANWHRVALRLGVDVCVCKNVFKNHPNDCEGACRDMLDRWLRGDRHTGEEERTWSTLLMALGRAGFVELEGNLKRVHFKAE